MNVALAIVGSALVAAIAIGAAQQWSILERRGPVLLAIASQPRRGFRLYVALALCGLCTVLIGARASETTKRVVVSVTIAILAYDVAVWLWPHIRRAKA